MSAEASIADHWDNVWAGRNADEVSWYQGAPTVSLDLIGRVAGREASVVDVGGGASSLVGELRRLGYTDLTVVDISAAAIEVARGGLGPAAAELTWVQSDVTTWKPDRTFDVWHDRAVLHFLTSEDDRRRYVETLRSAINPGGHVVIATFDLAGPNSCSGLSVHRYDPVTMSETLGQDFAAVDFVEETHVTPGGAAQQFLYGLFRETGG